MDINNYQPIGNLVLVYQAEDGELHRQPAQEVAQVGTLVDPETDEEMELVGFILND